MQYTSVQRISVGCNYKVKVLNSCMTITLTITHQ